MWRLAGRKFSGEGERPKQGCRNRLTGWIQDVQKAGHSSFGFQISDFGF
jgi:hypothetical protein